LIVSAGYVKDLKTIDHLTSGCPILARNDYFMIRDRVGAYLHYSVCRTLDIKATEAWLTHAHTYTSQYVNMKV
jgi:hypothetical protein